MCDRPGQHFEEGHLLMCLTNKIYIEILLSVYRASIETPPLIMVMTTDRKFHKNYERGSLG